MPRGIQRIYPVVNPCVDREVRQFSEKVAYNNQLLEVIEGDVGDLVEELTTIVNENPASYFDNSIVTDGTPVARYLPPLKIQLVEDLGETTDGLAAAMLLLWDDDLEEYDVIGDPFPVYDLFGKWAHALDGDRGYLGWDQERGVLYMLDMDSPTERAVTLDADLESGDGPSDYVSAVDDDTGQAIAKVFGKFVMATKKIPATSNAVSIRWYPKKDNGDGTFGRWRAVVSQECLVDA